jgi:hypothetical protein
LDAWPARHWFSNLTICARALVLKGVARMGGVWLQDLLPVRKQRPSIEVIVQTSFLLDKSDCQRLTGKVAAIVTKDWHDLWPGVDSG